MSSSDMDLLESEDDFPTTSCNGNVISDYSSYSFYQDINLEKFREDPTDRILANQCTLLIASVVQNDVDSLKDLSNSPDWYEIQHPEDGNSLLQIGIICRKKEVCDYLISAPNFPLDHKNNLNSTALGLAMSGIGEFGDHISYELIKRGASVNTVQLEEDETLLQHSIEKSLVKVSKLLMEMGFDVNGGTCSPLWLCLDSSCRDEVETELVTALLCYGADPTVGTGLGYNTFEYAIKFCSFLVEEALFYYTFDRYTTIDIHFEVLLTLADQKSPFFHETIKHTNNVILGKSSLMYYHLLFLINTEYLDLIIKKCSDVIAQVFAMVTSTDYSLCSFCERMSLRNFDLLLESDLRYDTINFIGTFGDKFYFYCLIGFGYREYIVVENVCYLLSYGLRLAESQLKAFYKQYGYGDLVKIALHMDIEKKLGKRYIQDSFLVFLCDINMTLEKYLQEPCPYYRTNVHELLPYFAHPGLYPLCTAVKGGDAWFSQPKVPLLVELARNVFRSYFVRTFNIQSPKQFHGLVNALPISPGHKKIITYETKLYDIPTTRNPQPSEAFGLPYQMNMNMIRNILPV